MTRVRPDGAARGMAGRQTQLALLVLCVFAVGMAVRMLPRWWTLYPFNPDGFNFARLAELAIAQGRLTIPELVERPHGFAYPILIATLSFATGVDPLWLLQPSIAVIGTVPALFVVWFVVRGASGRAVVLAALAAGLFLATEGLYLRRTATVSYEVLGLLLVVSVAVACHRWLATGRRAWGLLVVPMVLVLPVTHHFSSMMAGLVLTALLAIHVADDRRVLGVPLVAAYWAYLLGYYTLVRVPYYDDVGVAVDVFLAWVVLLVLGALWVRRTSDAWVRIAAASVAVVGFGVLSVNALASWSPGTMATPPLLLLGIAPFGVLAVLAIWGVPIGRRSPDGPALLALFLAPIAWVLFALTAGVDPVYAMFAQRGQTFVHLATVVFAAFAAIDLGARLEGRWDTDSGWPVPRATVGVCVLLVVIGVVTVPVAFGDLALYSYQGTTTHEEFAVGTFATERVPGTWAGDDHLTRVASNYHGASTATAPVAAWAKDGEPPPCAIAVDRGWTERGAQLYPAPPAQVEPSAFARLRAERSVVYAASSEVWLISPTAGASGC